MPDEDGQSSLESLEKKLEEAKKLEMQADEKETSGLGQNLSYAMRVSVELVAGVMVGAFAGYYLDKWLETKPLFLIVLALLGTCAGGVNVYRMVMKDTDNK